MRYISVELIAATMIALLIIGTVVTTVAGLNTTDGTGAFQGLGVRETGTNPWQ